MRVTYRGTALHDIGFLYLADGFEHLSPELPARQRRTLAVRLDTPDDVADWSAHRAALTVALAALAVPEGPLLVALDDGSVLHDRPVVVMSAPKLPQDTDPTGTFSQSLEVVFAWDEVLDPPRLATTFTPVGSGAEAVDLGEVLGFDTGSTAVRSSDYASFEERVGGKVSANGVVHAADPGASLAVRRADLMAKLSALEAALDVGSGTLRHALGDTVCFSRVVRRDEFKARINQAVDRITWSLDASYTRFPDEADFRLAKYSLRTSTNRETGEVLTTVSGTMRATTELAAHAAVDALATAHGGGAAPSPNDRDAQRVERAGGACFVEMSFNLGFKALSGSLVAASLRIEDADDLSAGMIARAYNGSVTMQADTWDAAYRLAVAKAETLGGGKHPFRLRSRVAVADNRATYDRVVTGKHHVAVEFSYEYRVTGDRVFVELTAETVEERFGQKSLSVQGRIHAATSAAAAGLHASIKTALSSGGRFRGGRYSERTERVAPGSVAVGTSYTPPRSDVSWGTAVNTGEAVDGTVLPTYARQFMGYDFSFTVFLQRASGQEVSLVYQVRTELDYRSLTKTTSVSGQVFARDADDAAGALATLQTALGAPGSLMRKGTDEGYERYLGTPAGVGSETAYLTGWNFTLEYSGAVTGEAALLECSASEQVTHSGLEPVVVRVARGRPKIQQHTYTEGRRQVRGSAVALGEATVRAWLDALLDLPTYQTVGGGVVVATAAPQVGMTWEMVPRTAGVLRGEGINVRVCRGELSYEQVFSELDHP